MTTEVPFGKYRGRPVEEMLADSQYMMWLEAQPWFRERFSHLRTGKDEDAMSRTPVHNKLQALFLDEAYQRAFVLTGARRWYEGAIAAAERFRTSKLAAIEKIKTENRHWAKRIEGSAQAESLHKAFATYGPVAETLQAAPAQLMTKAAFEQRGGDVVLAATVSILNASSDSEWDDRMSASRALITERLDLKNEALCIEIKPTVADEYPAVLRQMNRNKSEYLFVERYQGEGVTEAQFVAMFAASGKRVVFKRDVDAAL
jgi:hypothetical protein